MDGEAFEAELELLGVSAEAELEELTHNSANRVTDGIWRVRAGAFEAVVKVVVNRPGGDPQWQPSIDPQDWNYWRREPDAYRHGLSQLYAGSGLRSPRPLLIVDWDEATVALWIELARWADRARQLARSIP